MKCDDMKHTLMMGIFALACGVVTMASADETTAQHAKPGHQHRDAAYEHNKAASKPAEGTKVANADGKRLPGRDCKFYEGGTQQHGWPQYEIGNPQRPECPPETK